MLEYLFGFVELVQLGFGVLEAMAEVSALGLRLALGILQLLELALSLLQLGCQLGNLRFQLFGNLVRRSLKRHTSSYISLSTGKIDFKHRDQIFLPLDEEPLEQ